MSFEANMYDVSDQKAEGHDNRRGTQRAATLGYVNILLIPGQVNH